MKKIIIIIFLVNFYSIFSQSGHFDQLMFNYKGNSINLTTHPDFHREYFNLGWHWAQGKSMTKALKMNQIHLDINRNSYNPYYISSIETIFRRIADSSLIISNGSITYWSSERFAPIFATAMHYEPTLQISETTTENYLNRNNDISKPIFGFENIKGFIHPNTYTIADMSKLFLYKDSLNAGDTVLSKPWKGNELGHTTEMSTGGTQHPNYYNDPFYVGDTTKHLYVKETNNSEIYLSINLKRIGNLDTLLNNDIVLSIKLPFTNLKVDTIPPITGYIKFDSLPSSSPNDIINLPDSRGIARLLIGGNGNIFNITKNMLPKGNATQKDITISAHIRFCRVN